MHKLSAKVIEKLQHYVYLYINPLDNSVFYVGKGSGNRIYCHLNDDSSSKKGKIIRSIRARGKEPRIEILIHGLRDEVTALRVEAAVIDLLGKDTLANCVRGWGASIVGRMGLAQLMAVYDGQPAQIEVPALLIRINQRYRYGISDQELYEITRGVWKIGRRRLAAKYAFAVYNGIVKEVYIVRGWFPGGSTKYMTRDLDDVACSDRWEFVGNVASPVSRAKYIDKSVAHYFKIGALNPIMYVNC